MSRDHDKSPVKPISNSESPTNQAADLYRDLKPVIEEMPIGEVKLYERNARKHSKRQIELIANSFASFGCVSPLTVDGDGVLISGHGRLAAAKLLGRETVLVIRVEHLDDHQKRALRIADNQLATLAEWDANMLAIEFNDLLTIELSGEIQFDLSVTGFLRRRSTGSSSRRSNHRIRMRVSRNRTSRCRHCLALATSSCLANIGLPVAMPGMPWSMRS